MCLYAKLSFRYFLFSFYFGRNLFLWENATKNLFRQVCNVAERRKIKFLFYSGIEHKRLGKYYFSHIFLPAIINIYGGLQSSLNCGVSVRKPSRHLRLQIIDTISFFAYNIKPFTAKDKQDKQLNKPLF